MKTAKDCKHCGATPLVSQQSQGNVYRCPTRRCPHNFPAIQGIYDWNNANTTEKVKGKK